MPSAGDLGDLAAARDALADADRRIAANAVALREAADALDERVRAGAPAADRQAAEQRLQQVRGQRAALLAERGQRLGAIEAVRERIAAARPFEELVGELTATVPCALLPVRLEARFDRQATRLRVRVFPDQIHVANHDPALTAEEREAGERYWRDRWAVGVGADTGAAHAAWALLSRSLAPTRAAYVAQVLTPDNLADLGSPAGPSFPNVAMRAGPFHRAPSVELQPDRWVVVGFRGGSEVLRKWGAPVRDDLTVGPTPDPTAAAAPPAATPPAAEQPALPADPGVAWLLDYDEAERAGMAVTLTDQDLTAGLVHGLDQLVVVGVDWTLEPVDAADRLAELLAKHRAAAGVSVLRQGTPTNLTADSRPAPRLDELAGADLLDPATPAPALGDQAGGRRVARALGLADPAALDRLPGAAATDDLGAFHMHNALWEATWGYFLDQIMDPLVDDATIARVRDHARRWLRGRGPLPALRVASQPYGLLPVVADAGWRPGADVEDQIHQRMVPLRAVWARAVTQVARLGGSGRPDNDLLSVLATTPRSESFRFRAALGPVVLANVTGRDAAAQFQELSATMLLAIVGITRQPFGGRLALDDAHRRFTIPLVQRGVLSETDRLAPDYISGVAQQVLSTGGLLRLLRPQRPLGTLLHLLLAHGAQLEIAKGALRTVAEFETTSGGLTRARVKITPVERELHAIEQADDTPPRFVTTLDGAISATAVAFQALQPVSGNRALADHFATLGLEVLRGRRPTRELAGFLDSLGVLAGLPTAELERLLTETLDCASHRLDAWFTSLASRRLDGLRAATPAGVHVGGFGWVENLRPQAASDSLGYVHAPSVAQAATAAVLRSGYLSHRASGPDALAVDLSSSRVRLALDLLDGVREGQPLGALLGYRFERGLRERRVTLARYILPIRQLAPLATSTDERAADEPLEAVAARDVVNGVRLLKRWRDDPAAFFAQPGLPAVGADRDDVDAELRRLADVLDAVSDLLLAEGVFQAVMGNSERAGAAIDALDRQTGLPDVEVTRTPRAGVGFSHRLLLLFGDQAPPAAWAATAGDARAAAEPRLNAWVARVLGDPGLVRFAGEAVDADGAVVASVRATLAQLGLSPLATVFALVGGARGAATELEERLAARLAAQVHDERAAELHLLDQPPAGSPATVIGLGVLRTLARAVVELLSGCRFATARDLAPDTERLATGLDAAELRGRADHAVGTLAQAAVGLDALAPDADAGALAAALLAAAAAGARGAVSAAADREALAAQAAVVRTAVRATLDDLAAREAGFDRAAADALQQVTHDQARLRTVFGDHFPVLPRFVAANGAELAASHAARTTLLGGDGLAPAAWLQRMALVRPAVARIADVLAAAEVLGREVDATGLAVCQLPHALGDRWLAQPLPADRTLPRGTLSLAIHAPGAFDPAHTLAGVVVDQWSETLPASGQTTGLTVHHDAPGSRAPQSLLLAIPPDPAATTWDFDALLGAVREALELAKLRLVDPQHAQGAGRFLPALWFPFNLQADTPSIDFPALENAEVLRRNQAFLADGGGTP